VRCPSRDRQHSGLELTRVGVSPGGREESPQPSPPGRHPPRDGLGAERIRTRARTARWAGDRVQTYVMFVPALALLVGVMYPFLRGVVTSLTDEKLYIANPSFVGLANYSSLFRDAEFLESLRNTIVYVIVVLAVQVPLGIGVAVLLNLDSRLQKLLRSVLVLPLLIPPIVAALMWKTMMQPSSGVLNWLLSELRLPTFAWLSDTSTALVSIVLIDTWIYMPFAALILLAGLQSVPAEQLEAAKVDGASRFALFRYIEFRWITPYILLVMLFRTADALKQFELIYPTTRGGPINATRLLHVKGYEEAFRWSNTSRAMAIILVLWAVSYLFSIVLVRSWQRRSGEMAA
jgi:multiple sugar transport system permease protein